MTNLSLEVDGIVKAQEKETRFYLVEVESKPEESMQLTEDNLIIAMTDGGDFGHSVEVKEIHFRHAMNTMKYRGNKTLKDISITEAMYFENLKEREAQSDEGKRLCLFAFNKQGKQLYGYYGQINDFNGSFSGEYGTVQYTFSPSEKNIVATEPTT